MAFWYRRMKLGFDLPTRRCISKITAPKPPVSITNHSNQLRSTLKYQPVSVTKLLSHTGCSGYRCYHVDPQVKVIKILLQVSLAGLVVLIGRIIWIGDVETIPFTKRKHFLLMPHKIERVVGVYLFEMMKEKFEGRVLPEMHPDRVRVAMILNHLTEAVQTGLKKEGVKLGISHLEGLEWEVLVVKNDEVNACCLPSGKIFVFTGLLHHFTTDDEIATIISHEVAHVVARHVAEKFSKFVWLKWSKILLGFPLSQRMEIEADYIGLLLMAYAGYDPRVAPKVYEKMDQIEGDSGLQEYLSTHPLGDTRSKILSKASVMKEAISIYEEAIAGRDVDT